MTTYYTNRVLTRQWVENSTFAGGLANAADATPNLSQLGNSLYVTDGSSSLGFRYVQLAASIGALVLNAPMYFTDQGRRTVDSTIENAASYAASSDSALESAAGLILNVASPVAAGYGVWLQISGLLAAIPAPGSVVKGDRMVLSNAAGTPPTINVFVRVAAGTAPGTPEAMAQLYIMALASQANNVVTGWICGGCGLP